MKRSVWIALPAYTGVVHISTMRSIMGDLLALAKRGDSVSMFDEVGNALIGDTRAQIVASFLKSNGTHLVFVDWDVCWANGGVPRLVDHDVDLVAGMYPMRSDPIRFQLRSEHEGGEGLFIDPSTGLVEVWGVSAGFMCCSRKMLEMMVAAHPELAFTSEKSPGGTAWALFDPYRVEGGNLKLGEDYAFCQRWRDLGGKVWIDPAIGMGHTGLKTFVGDFAQWVDQLPKDEKAA
ncbi:hypothetical protein [uncultured Hyphomicrobium sp.]|uniref:hypothetical protein n=1 Tax=uncultured Hyphomicrobium sp. TaxID=194373 RepID=UPI0025D5BB34|nr:hypothetical protein [uncultured Hyphomicrobium sp.]